MDKTKRIRHTVVFKLKHANGSSEERNFLTSASALSFIDGVENFELLKQISQKNSYDWGISMEFASQAIYDCYNQHPDHVTFVENRWLKEVDHFLEIDYQL
ncbi:MULTISPECIES: Dabb family protein [unclassified Spirosoma]|uniref:Dabb family protein n=1 Tax=unclassified Spirosoma TaxID=2621999 RepID=UPI000960CBB0|nr:MULTISPECIES: Dabb family protein [unclassified Spirosoma]MBN8825043.1 Dabb family protein [Spirosoma sp.]OJW73336.1 MAG: stress responsive alpha-beta barrel domain-containing protein [Spirosoma sp. 48-14]